MAAKFFGFKFGGWFFAFADSSSNGKAPFNSG